MSVNADLQDAAIQHAVALTRYGAGLSDRIVKLLNSADSEILDKLAARLAAIDERGYDIGPKTTARLAKLLEELSRINAAIYAQVHDELEAELTDFSVGEAGFQKAALESSLVVDVGTVLPSVARLKAIVSEAPLEGRLLRDWVKGMEQARLDRLGQAIRLGMFNGEGTDRIVARIRGTRAARYSDGVLDISRRSAQSIVRTAVTHVSNVTAQETWKSNSHVVKAWRFLATLDSRTTITCAGLDGQTFPIGEGPIPPRHIRCRSISVAVTKSWRELGVNRDELPKGDRASMDGQVSGSPRFAEWLRTKGDAMQDKVLGKTRADLFRSGKLNVEQFIRGDGTVLTLDELRAKYGEILS